MKTKKERVGTLHIPAGSPVWMKRIGRRNWKLKILDTEFVIRASVFVEYADQGTMRAVRAGVYMIKFSPSLMYSRGYKSHPKAFGEK